MVTASRISRKLCPYERQKDISWISSRKFRVLAFTFRAVAYLKFCAWCEVWFKTLFFIQISMFSSIVTENTFYCTLNCSGTLIKDHLTVYFWSLYLVYLLPFYCFLLIYLSMFMFITQC